MRRNRVRQQLGERRLSLGLWIDDRPAPDRLEQLGRLGLDYVILEAEHEPLTPATCRELVRACDLAGMATFVRVPDRSPSTILAYLEIGVMGIYVPHVSTAADARAIVDAVKYAPEGRRSSGGGTRAADYGFGTTPAEYFAHANRQTMVCALLEDVDGVANLESIAAVPGIDCVELGPGDLSHSLGHPGQKDHPQVRAVLDDAQRRIDAGGIAWMYLAADAEQAAGAIERGCLMVTLLEREIVLGALRRELEQARRAVAAHSGVAHGPGPA